MESHQLISALALDARPVRRLRRPSVRALHWALSAILCVGLAVCAAGIRSDLPRKMHDASFLLEGGSLFSLFALSAWNAFQCSVPGARSATHARSLPFAALLFWLLSLAARHVHAATGLEPGWSCVARMAGLTLIPASMLLFMLRRAAPFERGWAGFFAVSSAGTLAALGTQVLCAKDAPLHLLVWHGGPWLIAALAGVGLGKSLLRSPDIMQPGRRPCVSPDEA